MVDRDREYVEFVAASGSLRRTAYLVCGDWHRADDVVQDALYNLYRSWAKVDRGGNPLAYARRVVVNAALDSGRRPWRREVPTADLPSDRVVPGDHADEHAERDEVLTKNRVACSCDVHEAIRTGDRLAARFTIHAELRRGRTISTEVYLFGELAPDGRMRRTTQATRDVSA
jgi:DNA-directed RNA polymerase specialized sigma24 family protein